MKLKTKDLLTLAELTPKEFAGLIDGSIRLKKELGRGRTRKVLKGKTLAMLFQKPSTRTRVSFEVGMYQLGGHAVNLDAGSTQLSRGESVSDTAKTLSRYADCIMARVYDHALLEGLAGEADIPVINGLSDMFHPCQILADFMTIKERFGRLAGLKVAWIGDGNNVCNSMVYGAALSGVKMAIATPKGFGPDRKVVSEARRATSIEVTADPLKAATGADVVVTDTFNSIHNDDPGRIKRFVPKYQVSPRTLKAAKGRAIFLHCLPAKRGEEVLPPVIDGPQSAVWDETENRLHTQKALLSALMTA